MTRLNKTILETLQNSEGHMTAEDMFLYCKGHDIKVSLASVYRILGNLSDEGYITRLSFAGKPDVFDKTLSDHQHIVCERCGKIQDVFIENLKSLLEENAGVELSSYSLSLRFICPDCRKTS